MTSGIGTCSVTATKAADDNYNSKTSPASTVAAAKADQAALTVTAPNSATYGDLDATITTSGGSGTGTVTFDAGTSTACSIVSGKLHVVSGTGTCSITATKAGNDNYNPTTSAAKTITINKANQTALSITAPTSATYGEPDATITTSGGSGTGTVTFDAGTSTACSIVSGKLHVVSGTGTCSITATKAGDDDYNPTTSAAKTIAINKAVQTITFGTITDKVLGAADFDPAATADSGLTVSYSSSTTAVCTIVSGKIHLVAVGKCTVTASQSGNANYASATPKTQSFNVTFTFVGFSAPVNNPKWINKLKAGQAVPFKWRLLDANGAPVTNLSGATMAVGNLNCAEPDAEGFDAIEEFAAGSSGLQNLGDGYYQLNWKSLTSYANSCRTVSLNLGEGFNRLVWFQFTK
jgi:trimeric autotransporter adhesin